MDLNSPTSLSLTFEKMTYNLQQELYNSTFLLNYLTVQRYIF